MTWQVIPFTVTALFDVVMGYDHGPSFYYYSFVFNALLILDKTLNKWPDP